MTISYDVAQSRAQLLDAIHVADRAPQVHGHDCRGARRHCRFDRRRVLLAADVVRGAAVGLMAVLSLTGTLELWHMFGLVALYGAGTAFFGPAFDAIVPDLLPESELAQANSLDQFMRPICFRLAGPALGGWLVAGLGVGTAFAVDTASFALSAAMVLAMSSRESHARGGHSVAADLRQGFRFVRGNVWLWGTLGSAAVAYFLFLGPVEVLLPYVVKNSLHGSAAALGLVFAAGGLGSVGAASPAQTTYWSGLTNTSRDSYCSRPPS